MSRPVKDFGNAHKNKLHKAALERRRKKAAEKRGLQAAVEAAEGEANFHEIVEAEKTRLGKNSLAVKGGQATPTRIAAARENLSSAFDLMGGVPALVKWGKSNPTEFYRLWARLIPKESVEVSAQLPLEALLSKLSSREGESVQEAAYQIGTEMLEEARHRVLEADYTELPGPDDRIN